MHRRALLARAGLVVAVASAATGLFATPALAATTFTVAVTQAPGDFNPGSTQNLKVEISNTAEPVGQTVTVSISGLTGDLSVGTPTGGCGVAAAANSCKFKFDKPDNTATKVSITFPIKANATVSVPAGNSANVTATITGDDGNGNSDSTTAALKVNGPNPASLVVPQVSGVVKDVSTGTPIAGAEVTLQDVAGKTFTAKTNAGGVYTITSTADKGIAPGLEAILVTKEGYTFTPKTFDANGGQAVRMDLAMSVQASASPTVSAPPASVGASEPGTTDTIAAEVPAKSSGGLSLILIISGAVLVLAGIGAIVMILVRRRGSDDDDDDDDDAPVPPRRGPPPAAPGYRDPATTSAARAGGYPDRTAASRAPLADAPTMMHGAGLADEYPDPYGAPPRSPAPVYGGGRGAPEPTASYGRPAAAGGYDGYDRAGYDQPTTYSAAARPAAEPYVGAERAGTGRYERAGYGQPDPAPGYGPADPAPVYGSRAGYAPEEPPATGYRGARGATHQAGEPGYGAAPRRQGGTDHGYGADDGRGYGAGTPEYGQAPGYQAANGYAGDGGYPQRNGYSPAATEYPASNGYGGNGYGSNGYGGAAATGGYSGGHASGYGADAGYGYQAPGGAPDPRFDEPTSYGGGGHHYGGQDNGYASSPVASSTDYDQRGYEGRRYAEPANDAPAYPPADGYDQRGGYPPAGRGAPPRRPVDWMDD